MPALPSPHSLNSPLCTPAPSFWTEARLVPLGTSSQRELHQVTPRLQVSPGLTSHWSGEEAGLRPTETGVIQTCSIAVHTLSISRTQGPNPFQESWASCSSEGGKAEADWLSGARPTGPKSSPAASSPFALTADIFRRLLTLPSFSSQWMLCRVSLPLLAGLQLSRADYLHL